MILFYHFVQIIIVLIAYWIILYHAYNKTIQLFTYRIVFIIVGFDVLNSNNINLNDIFHGYKSEKKYALCIK